MRAVTILLLIALVATVLVRSEPEDIQANRPPNEQGDNLQARLNDRTAKAKGGIANLRDLLDRARKAIARLTGDINQNDTDLDQHWVLFGIPLVLLVIVGYTLLEAGNVRSVNVHQIVMKNVLIATLSAFIWWFVGYGFSYGDNRRNGTANGFIGNGLVFLASDKETPSPIVFGHWTYTWAYAVMACIIATQSLGERARTAHYVIWTVLFVGFIYPVVVHWCWSTSGWISPHVWSRATFARTGVVDHAGSGVVHLTAGLAALAGAIILRGRQGRFDEDYQRQFPQKFRPGNRVYQGLGILFIWVAWYGLTAISPEYQLHNKFGSNAARTTINTTLAAAWAALATIALDCLIEGRKAAAEGEAKQWRINLFRLFNGIIAGLVAISAGCHVVEPWAAMFIGALGAVFYVLFARLVIFLGIDDPLEVFASHAVPGVVGLMCVGWFARYDVITKAYGWTLDERQGIWYGGNAGQWGVQSFAAFVITCWAFGIPLVFYFVLRFFGLVRVLGVVEAEGIDANEQVYNPKEEKKAKKDATA